MHALLYMAMSVNGMVARPGGDEDFLSHEHWDMFSELAENCGCFIIGRKTYETVKNWDEKYSFDDFSDAIKVILTKDSGYTASEGYLIAHSPKEALEILRQKDLDKALVAGGPETNSAFAEAGLIDEIWLGVEPILIGKGEPLFAEGNFDLDLHLTDAEKRGGGLLLLKYSVSNGRICSKK